MSIPVFSVHGLVAWLETQDPATEYDYNDCSGDCLYGHYAKAVGVDFYALHTHFWKMSDLVFTAIRPWTYGAALARAKEII